jgi:hypothetical protein
VTATFDFTAGATSATGFDIDLMNAAPVAPASFDPIMGSGITKDNPLLVASLPEIATDAYVLRGNIAVHRTGSAMLIGGGLYSSHYTQTIDLVHSTITSVTPVDTTHNGISITFSSPQAYLFLADTALGMLVTDGDVLNFSALDDTVQSTDHREIINLGAGNDFVLSRGGDDLIDGGAGIDTSAYEGDRALFVVTHVGVDAFSVADTVTMSTDALVDVERLQFDDGRVAIDIDGTNGAGAVYRIYQAAFDRTPDIGGLTFWVEKADLGMTTIDIAARFMDSDEFRALYGSSAPDPDTFVEQVYGNVLHRTADTGGLDYWLGQIADGMSEAEVLARFADSAENRANVVGIIDHGIALNAEGDYSNPPAP